jgi:hypothetical protein
MATIALHQAAFPFLSAPAGAPAAANEARRRAPEPAQAPAGAGAEPRRLRRAGGDRRFDPTHVTLRWRADARAARDRAGRDAVEAAVRAAVAAAQDAGRFHVFHASLRSDGVHLLVQAAPEEALAAGLARVRAGAERRLNRLLCRIGPLFEEGWVARAGPFREALRFFIGPEHADHAAHP